MVVTLNFGTKGPRFSPKCVKFFSFRFFGLFYACILPPGLCLATFLLVCFVSACYPQRLPSNCHRLPNNRHQLPTKRHRFPAHRHRRAYWTLRVFFIIIAAPPGLRTACGQRRVGSKNSQTTPATTSTAPIRQLLGAADVQTAHPPPHSAQPLHTNHWAPRTRKRHQQERRPQRPSERSDPTQHAKGRMGDCPGPRKGTATRRNVTQGGGRPGLARAPNNPRPPRGGGGGGLTQQWPVPVGKGLVFGNERHVTKSPAGPGSSTWVCWLRRGGRGCFCRCDRTIGVCPNVEPPGARHTATTRSPSRQHALAVQPHLWGPLILGLSCKERGTLLRYHFGVILLGYPGAGVSIFFLFGKWSVPAQVQVIIHE